jgi:hypothetical protein
MAVPFHLQENSRREMKLGFTESPTTCFFIQLLSSVTRGGNNGRKGKESDDAARAQHTHAPPMHQRNR